MKTILKGGAGVREFEILFYDKPGGTEPAKDFILSLDIKMRAKILMLIDVLASRGNELREPYSKPLGDGIFELRAKVGSDISRGLYFFCIGHRIVFTNGFIKKSRKTPPIEIERARCCRAEFLRRKECS